MTNNVLGTSVVTENLLDYDFKLRILYIGVLNCTKNALISIQVLATDFHEKRGVLSASRF